MKTLRITVPCPNHDTIKSQTEVSLERTKIVLKDKFNVEICRIKGTAISHQRCEGANLNCDTRVFQDTFEREWDYYLALDADIEFNPMDILALMKHDLPIVSGAYMARSRPNSICAGDFVPGTKIINHSYFLKDTSSGIHEIDWCGMGFCLIQRDVLKKMRYPWWREVFYEYNDNGVLRAHYLGDDIGFCINARDSGFKIFVDCDVRVKHHCQ